MSERLVPDLAAAVLDGTSIDWATAESSADDTSRPLLAELKVLAALAEVHRRLPLHADTRAPTDPGGALTHWGHLRLLERIGRGSFGEVYRAWDSRLDREVALKLIDAEAAGGDGPAPSIIHEGRLLARVRHPNVVTVYGAEQIGERIGLWMEFVRGRTLRQIVDEGTVFSGADAIRIGIDLAHAVGAVHSAGVLHRDIKAQNVTLADDGRAVLIDFGTGRDLADHWTTDLAGTPLYVAPEILAGGDATVQSDIYSLGVLLYHLVTGSYPVRGESLTDIRLAHQRNDRTAIRSARGRSDLSPQLVRIIERAIDPRPDIRYASAGALVSALVACQRRPMPARFRYTAGAAAALLLIAALGWEMAGRRLGYARTPGALISAAAGRNVDASGSLIPSHPIIAVLPLQNLNKEPDSDQFVDGLTEEIIRNLSEIRGLQVRSRDSSFAFKNTPRDIGDVGRRLGVNLVLEGSVLRSGNKLRVHVQLIQVADNVLLWSDPFDRELKDIFAIQDDMSRAIVNKLRLTLGRGQRPYDANVEAYELYLKGKALVGRGGVPNLERAVAAFEEVLAKDPGFAPAHAGLAIAKAIMSQRSGSTVPFVEAQAIIRTAAFKAGELDPLLPDAHEAMGWVHARDLEWSTAERSFQRAIDLNPTVTQIYTSYSLSTLRPLGKADEALRLLRVALENDPLSLELQRQIAEVLSDAGRYEEAITMVDRIRAVDPGFPFADMLLARALAFAGRPAEALEVYERKGRGPRGRRDPRMVLAYVGLGMRAEAEALAAEHHDSAPSNLAVIYAALGDKDRAFEALERTVFVEPQRLPILLAYSELAALRGDPRLAALRQRLRLPPQ